MRGLTVKPTTPLHAQEALFARIILPIPVPKLFTYGIPAHLIEPISEGSRVIVPFGKAKILTGVVEKIHNTPPQAYEAKYILDVLDDTPTVNTTQLAFFRWLANYYLCTLGEVVKVALPTGLKLNSQSKIQLHPAFNKEAAHNFSPKETMLLHALQKRSELTYNEAANVVAQKNIHHLLKSLLRKQAVLLFEKLKEKYRPKKIKSVRLNTVYTKTPTAFQALLEQLERKAKQLDVLLKYIEQVPLHKANHPEDYYLNKSVLTQAGISSSSLHTLIKKEIFIEEERIVSRFDYFHQEENYAIELSPTQSKASQAIHQQFLEKDTVLFHGVTGSGKTEVYIQLIQGVLESGGQVLYLLPEIALTTQIVRRLRKIFGNQMAVYHSKYADNERVEVWNGVLEDKFPLIVGVRSSIFLPFANLQLIIADEEHEIAYKQFEPAPRYHARDAALVLAKYHQAKVLLGSATPSIESYYHAQQGKYGFVKLTERFGQVELPAIILANLRIERQRKTLQGDFSAVLLDELRCVLAHKEQAIIFQNRRGYAPYVTCEACTWIPTCAQCAVSLTYHQLNHYLSCHYCGYRIKPPSLCHVCGSHRLKEVGFGTEKLEEALQLCFPLARIQRMDLDTTRSKYSYERIIEQFEQGSIDLLVGTQMVTKGLDFSKVSLVGVLDVDRMIYFPEFRASERCFQLLTQVSGRAGRRDKQGKVIIQTLNPHQAILKKIVQHDYESMYQRELAERKQFRYPPYVRLIKLTLKHTDQELVTKAGEVLAKHLRRQLGKLVLGPQAPVIPKLRNQYLIDIWTKIKRDAGKLAATKEIITKASSALLVERAFKQTQIIVDIDPM